MTTAAEIEAQENAGGVEEESDDESLFVEGATVGETEESAKDDSVPDAAHTRSKVSIKREEGEEGAMDSDEISAIVKAPDSPELKKSEPKKGPTGEQKLKKSSAPKDAEAEIIAEELQQMLDLFTVQDDNISAENGTATNAALEGHMFLFQFPPVLPPLKVVPREGDGTSANPNPVKAEPDDDIVMLNQPPVNIDLTADTDNKVKTEGDGEENEDGEGQGKEKGDELKEGGFLGNLIVRKSGKVELSYGGLTMTMMPGIQTNFLSTAALIEHADVKPNDPTQMAGVAYGMGKIQGTFTLAPQWGDEDDWVVDPQDLETPEE
jgi:DNA-directed RNA polymerase III subunit RPC4